MPTSLTPIQELIQPLDRYSELFENLFITVKPPRNKVMEKYSTINAVNKKKKYRNKFNEDEEGDIENNNN